MKPLKETSLRLVWSIFLILSNLQGFAATVEDLRKKAEAGDAKAQIELGMLYLDGKGVRKDAVEGVTWLRMAADQGDARGQVELGLAYATGTGVSKDVEKAFDLYRKSAEQGYAKHK